MQRTKDNSRQIPKTKDYMAHKQYNDYLYGYLQSISKWDGRVGHNRYVYKSSINFTAMAKMLGKSRQTVSRKFKFLLEGDENTAPLIKYDQQKKVYELLAIKQNLAMLVPQDTLQLLLDTVQQDVISTYVYLYNRYYANYQQEFYFSFIELRTVLGKGIETRQNDKYNNILRLLQKIGLLEYEKITVKNQTGQIKTKIVVKKMTNYIDD